MSLSTQIGMLYGLLHMRIRERVVRATVTTFDELLQRVCIIEAVQ